MSRDRILSAVRGALDPSHAPARRSAASARIALAPKHPRPNIAKLEGDERMARFAECLAALGVDRIEVQAADEVPAAIATYLSARGLPLRLRRGADDILAWLPWHHAFDLVVDIGPAQADDAVGLSRALAGAAETGTLALASGPGNPVTLSFLPDTHVVVLSEQAIVASYEDAIARVLAENGGVVPRTINLVTGASRTGDIGGKIVMGAHGPRRLAVILIRDGAQRT